MPEGAKNFLVMKTIGYYDRKCSYWRSFVYGVTKSMETKDIGRANSELRCSNKFSKFVWNKEGVYERINKKKERDLRRQLASRQQSTSLVRSLSSSRNYNLLPFIPRSTRDWVTGVFMSVEEVDVTRVVITDFNSVVRPYRGDSKYELTHKYSSMIAGNKAFPSLEGFIKYLEGPFGEQATKRHNEVMARVRWDSADSVAFFKDNLQSRLVAQLRAKDLAKRLMQQRKEDGVQDTTPITIPIRSYLLSKDKLSYILGNTDCYPEDERTKDIESSFLHDDPRIRGVAILLMLEKLDFNYASFAAYYDDNIKSTNKNVCFASYLIENIEELLLIASDLSYETSEQFFEKFVTPVLQEIIKGEKGQLFEFAVQFFENFVSPILPETIKGKKSKLFKLAVACISPERFEELIVRVFPKQTYKYALHDLHLRQILIKSENELMDTNSSARNLLLNVLHDYSIPFDYYWWIYESAEVRGCTDYPMLDFELALEILKHFNGGKENYVLRPDFLTGITGNMLGRLLRTLRISITNGCIPSIDKLRTVFLKNEEYIVHILFYAVEVKNWYAALNILNCVDQWSVYAINIQSFNSDSEFIGDHEKKLKEILEILVLENQLFLIKNLFAKIWDNDKEDAYRYRRQLMIRLQRATIVFAMNNEMVSPEMLGKLCKLPGLLPIYETYGCCSSKENQRYVTLSRNVELLLMHPIEYLWQDRYKYANTKEEVKRNERINILAGILAGSPSGNISTIVGDSTIFNGLLNSIKSGDSKKFNEGLAQWMELDAVKKLAIPQEVLINIKPNEGSPTLLTYAVQQKAVKADNEIFITLVRLAKKSGILDVPQRFSHNYFISFFVGIFSHDVQFIYKTPLRLSIDAKQFDKAIVLISAGADVVHNINKRDIIDILCYAAPTSNGVFDSLKGLLTKLSSKDINAKVQGKTMLSYAIEQGNIDKVNLILSYDILNINLETQVVGKSNEINSLLQQAKYIQAVLKGGGSTVYQKAQFKRITQYICQYGVLELMNKINKKSGIGYFSCHPLFVQALIYVSSESSSYARSNLFKNIAATSLSLPPPSPPEKPSPTVSIFTPPSSPIMQEDKKSEKDREKEENYGPLNSSIFFSRC